MVDLTISLGISPLTRLKAGLSQNSAVDFNGVGLSTTLPVGSWIWKPRWKAARLCSFCITHGSIRISAIERKEEQGGKLGRVDCRCCPLLKALFLPFFRWFLDDLCN